MSNENKHTTNKLITALDLPKDLFLGLPNISMSGNQELYISNHKGILSYGQEDMTILVKDYQILIKGKNLCISYYTKNDLTVCGYIRSIEFV